MRQNFVIAAVVATEGAAAGWLLPHTRADTRVGGSSSLEQPPAAAAAAVATSAACSRIREERNSGDYKGI